MVVSVILVHKRLSLIIHLESVNPCGLSKELAAGLFKKALIQIPSLRQLVHGLIEVSRLSLVLLLVLLVEKPLSHLTIDGSLELLSLGGVYTESFKERTNCLLIVVKIKTCNLREEIISLLLSLFVRHDALVFLIHLPCRL